MKEKLAKLIDVKSIMTIVLTIVFAALSFTGEISEVNFMDIFKLIVIFYFGTQVGKNTQAQESRKGAEPIEKDNE